MKELKFRGKSQITGEWVVGTYIDGYIISGVIEANSEYISIENWEAVHSDSVGQYTGLKDKNGVEIYEGDVLVFNDTGEEGYEYKEGYDFENRASVCFENGRFELEKFASSNSGVLEEMESAEHELFIENFKLSKVIGNIYANPELIK